MGITKRDFLVGAGSALAGAGALGAAQWIIPRGTHFPDAREPAAERQPEAGPGQNPAEGAKTVYAQFGEDLIIAGMSDWLTIMGKPFAVTTFIDLGAAHPSADNNTYLFYLRGARGILVEPNVDLIPVLKEARPEDIVLNVGVGLTDQAQADYYLIAGNPGLNTFDKERAAKLPVERVVKMPLVNVNKILAEHLGAAPDFFSVDVEGLDFDILKSLDFAKYRPKVFCAETLSLITLKHDTEITRFMASKGYVPVAQTVANVIYLDKEIFNPW